MAIVLTMGFLCPSNRQSKHYASKHAQTQFSFSQATKKTRPLPRQIAHSAYLPFFARRPPPLDFDDQTSPQDFVVANFKAPAHLRKGLDFVLSLRKAIFFWNNFGRITVSLSKYQLRKLKCTMHRDFRRCPGNGDLAHMRGGVFDCNHQLHFF